MTTRTMQRRDVLAARGAQPVALASEGREHTRLMYTQIRTDGGTQMRAGLNSETVNEYAEFLNQQVRVSEWPFPPVVVYHDGADYWLADGFHRLAALRKAYHWSETNQNITHTIPAEVRPGTRRDAILHAAQANAIHGLRRTNADKRRAVETLLRDEEWGQWSNREIARRCKVDEKTVRNIRETLTAENPQSEPAERTYTTKHGTTATMNVAGQRQAAQERAEQFVEVWQLERGVRAMIAESGTPDKAIHARYLREARDNPGGVRWSYLLKFLPSPHRQRDVIQALNNVIEQLRQQMGGQPTQPNPPDAGQRTLNTYDTQNLIWRALNDAGGEPAERLAWLTSEQGMDISSYEKYLVAGTVIAPGAFDLVWRLVHDRLTEMVAADESRAAEAERWQAAAPAAGPGDAWRQYATSVATEMGAPAEVAGLGCKLDTADGCEAHQKRQAGIRAELEFWAGAQKRVERIGELTGQWTGPAAALGRAIGDVLKLLQENVSE